MNDYDLYQRISAISNSRLDPPEEKCLGCGLWGGGCVCDEIYGWCDICQVTKNNCAVHVEEEWNETGCKETDLHDKGMLPTGQREQRDVPVSSDDGEGTPETKDRG